MGFNIGIVGAGKVGCALALGFKNEGLNITGLYSRSESSYKHLSDMLGLDFSNNLADTVRKSNVIFLSVPDNNIEDAAESIIRSVDAKHIENKTFFHLSGALTSDSLKSLKDLGAHTASIHPVQSFADRVNGWRCLYSIYYGFEGEEAAYGVARMLFDRFNGTIVSIGKENKVLYHSAACFISNYTVALSYITGEILSRIGFDEEFANKAFLPLLRNTVDNLGSYGSVSALTGPISRGDLGTIGKHISKLADLDAGLCDVYRILGEKTVEIAIKKGTVNLEEARKMREILTSKIPGINGVDS